MLLAPTTPAAAHASPPSGGSTPLGPALVRLHYVMRAPRDEVRTTEIDASVAPGNAGQRVEGSFADAVRAAQAVAAVPVEDGLHQMAVNPAQAVIDAGDGSWLVAPIIAEHRGAVGPLFIDGDFFRRTGLAVWAQRLETSPTVQAVVGESQVIDLRHGRRHGAILDIERALAEIRPAADVPA